MRDIRGRNVILPYQNISVNRNSDEIDDTERYKMLLAGAMAAFRGLNLPGTWPWWCYGAASAAIVLAGFVRRRCVCLLLVMECLIIAVCLGIDRL